MMSQTWDGLFVSGPWKIVHHCKVHQKSPGLQMDANLEFVGGTVTGEGTDGILGRLAGSYDAREGTCSIKVYQPNGSVEIWEGVGDGMEIRGSWKDIVAARPTKCHGRFRMWPLGLDDEEEEEEGRDIEAVDDVGRASRRSWGDTAERHDAGWADPTNSHGGEEGQ